MWVSNRKSTFIGKLLSIITVLLNNRYFNILLWTYHVGDGAWIEYRLVTKGESKFQDEFGCRDGSLTTHIVKLYVSHDDFISIDNEKVIYGYTVYDGEIIAEESPVTNYIDNHVTRYIK